MEPDIVEKINMHVRLQKEREKEQIKRRLEEEKRYEDEDEGDDWKDDCHTILSNEDRVALAEEERR